MQRPRILIALFAILGAVISAVWANDPTPETLVDGGHWKRARVILEPRVQANSNDAQALWLLSRVKREYHDLDTGLQLAEKAAALDPRNAAYRWQVAEVVGEIADKSGNPFKRLSYGRRYRREAEATIALDPSHVDAREGLMEWHMQAGAIGGKKEMGPVLAAEIASLNLARGYLAQARLVELQEKKDPLEPFYLKAVEVGTKSYLVRKKLAEFYFSDKQRKYDLAEKHAREALEIDPARIDAYGLLAQVLARQQRWTDLEAVLVQSEKMIPDDLSPCFRAADVLLADGSDLARAGKYFHKYLTQDPEPTAPKLDDARKKLNAVLARIKSQK